jgi:hypothetical protein
MFSSHHQCNGESKTFENYTFHVTGWMMRIVMGYMLLPEFSKSYRTGGWARAKYYRPNIPDIRFQHDNMILFGALTSSAYHRARRYLLEVQSAMDTGSRYGSSFVQNLTVKITFCFRRCNISNTWTSHFLRVLQGVYLGTLIKYCIS